MILSNNRNKIKPVTLQEYKKYTKKLEKRLKKSEKEVLILNNILKESNTEFKNKEKLEFKWAFKQFSKPWYLRLFKSF